MQNRIDLLQQQLDEAKNSLQNAAQVPAGGDMDLDGDADLFEDEGAEAIGAILKNTLGESVEKLSAEDRAAFSKRLFTSCVDATKVKRARVRAQKA